MGSAPRIDRIDQRLRKWDTHERVGTSGWAASLFTFNGWREPDDWNKVPFSHTVTVSTFDHSECWARYNNGVVVALVGQSPDECFTRGAAYVWCKTIRNGNGTPGAYPTAPVFGRFISKTARGVKVLSGKAAAVVLGAEYDQCFRPVGMVGRDADQFPRSEVPVAIPSNAIREDQPMYFGALQRQAKRLDEILCAMAHAVDMVDELADAEKAAGKADPLDKVHRQSRCYEVLEPIINGALRQSGQVEEGLADYLKASPALAHYLTRWQAKG